MQIFSRGSKTYAWIKFRALLICTVCATCLSHAQTNRIVCIGDSITQSDQSHFGYRYELWKMLVNSGISFDFVGSSTTNHLGNPSWPDFQGQSFDQDHEGHWGWRADQILESLPGWLNGYTPDIALIHIGSNDMNQDNLHSTTKDEIKQIITALRVDNPDVQILLCKLIPWLGKETQIQDLNDNYIAAIPGEMSSAQSPVILVDQLVGFNASVDTYDGIHPNATGELKVAQKFFDTLRLLDARSFLNLKGQPVGMTAFQLDFQAQAGIQYQVEMCSNLTTSTWQELILLQSVQGNTNVVDTNLSSNCAYRIQLMLGP